MMQDIDIIALVQAVKSLIEVQKERVSKVEKHMQKYGYTPLPPKQGEWCPLWQGFSAALQ